MIQLALNAATKFLLKGKQRERLHTERARCVGGGHSDWGDVATSHPTLQPPEAREAGTFSPRALGRGRTLLTL